MISTLALHRLRKFSHSKMILIFVIAGLLIGLIIFMPALIAKGMGSSFPGGGELADSYFDVIELFGALVAISLGVLLWRQDEKDGTISTFLARPISRVELLVSKLIGAIYALLIFLATSLVVYLIAHFFLLDYSIPALFVVYLAHIIVKWCAYLMFGLCFSCFVNSLLAAVLVIGYFFLGVIGSILSQIPYSTTETIGKVLNFIVMSRDKGFDLAPLLVSDVTDLTPLFTGTAYYALWALMLLSAAILMFGKREFSGKRS